jgi:hypothetical protein
VRGRQKGILDLKGSGSKGLHGSSARTKPTRRRRCLRAAPPALSHATQGLFERSPRPLPHPTETPNPPPFPSRGAIAPNPEVSLLAPGAVERSAENDQIPLGHTLPPSSQGPRPRLEGALPHLHDDHSPCRHWSFHPTDLH